jgi:predicted DNA-binding transcriptional regulator YafY
MHADIADILREAARQRRRVRVTYHYQGADRVWEAERHWEPYGVEGDTAIVFSYFRDEFRRVPLHEIKHVEITDETFEPRRPIQP